MYPDTRATWEELLHARGLRATQGQLREHRSDGGIGRALFPDLATELDAIARNASEVSSRDRVGTWITDQTELLRSGHFHTALARYPDAASGAAMSNAFRAMESITQHIGIELPEPEDFLAAGASLQHPDPDSASTLVPVPAPHGMGAAQWLRVFDGASGGGRPSLTFSTEVTRWFAALDRIGSLDAPSVVVRERIGLVVWTLRWIPGSVAAPLYGQPFRADWKSRYPTLPELLALAAIRHVAREAPIDTRSFTWLCGDLPLRSFAARYTHDILTDTIRISTRERSDRGAHIGTRLTT